MQNNCRDSDTVPGGRFISMSQTLIFLRKRSGFRRTLYPFHGAISRFPMKHPDTETPPNRSAFILYGKTGVRQCTNPVKTYTISGFACFLPSRADVFPRLRRPLLIIREKGLSEQEKNRKD